jgi:hypothetical protein
MKMSELVENLLKLDQNIDVEIEYAADQGNSSIFYLYIPDKVCTSQVISTIERG